MFEIAESPQKKLNHHHPEFHSSLKHNRCNLIVLYHKLAKVLEILLNIVYDFKQQHLTFPITP